MLYLRFGFTVVGELLFSVHFSGAAKNQQAVCQATTRVGKPGYPWWFCLVTGCEAQLPKANRRFGLLVFQVWSIFSTGTLKVNLLFATPLGN